MAEQEQHIESQVEGTEQEASEQSDPVHNLKSEFSRKFENVTSQLQQQNAQFEQILSMIQSQQAPQQQSVTDDIDDDIAYDGSKIKQYVNSTAEKIASDIVQKQTQAQQQSAAVVQQLSAKYPEFNDPSNPAYQKALEIHGKLDGNLKGTPQGTKMAMLEAAAELGLVPANKRQKADSADDFSLSGSKGSSSSARKQGKGDDDVDPKTLAFAKLLNPNKSDKDLKEGLKETSKRQKWNRYE